jgi:hypothetical protein
VTTVSAVEADWEALQKTAVTQKRPLVEVSTAVALNTIRCGRQMLADPLLDHYHSTLTEMDQLGFAAYAEREMKPYWRAAIDHFKD